MGAQLGCVHNDCTEAFELCCLEHGKKKKKEKKEQSKIDIRFFAVYLFLLHVGKLTNLTCVSSPQRLCMLAAALYGHGATTPQHLSRLSFTLTASTQTGKQTLFMAWNMQIYVKGQACDHWVCEKPQTCAAPHAPHRQFYQLCDAESAECWCQIRVGFSKMPFAPAQCWDHWALAVLQSYWKWFSYLLIKLY